MIGLGKSTLILLAALSFIINDIAEAGDVTLHDGTVIKGKLLSADQQALTINVDENEHVLIQIPLEQIKSISNLTEFEVAVVGTRLKALIKKTEPANQAGIPSNTNTQTNTNNTTNTNTANTTTATNNTSNNSSSTTADTKTPDTTTQVNLNKSLITYTADELRNVPVHPEYKALLNKKKTLRASLLDTENFDPEKTRKELIENLAQIKQLRSNAQSHLITGLLAFKEAQYSRAFKHFYVAAQFPEVHTLVKSQSGMEMTFLLSGTYALATSAISDADGTGWVDEEKKDYKLGRTVDPTTNGKGVTAGGARIGDGSGVIISDDSNGYGVFLAKQLSQTLDEVFGDKQNQLDRLYQTLLRLESGAINIYQAEATKKMNRIPFSQN